ncbi:MAG: bifunctional demethylmenaquinone methyltransferase/2-methoxy-6-polyprenyl-1,4-benzoquinol methylase UbiE [Candidatus Competibacteraceae bacterium]|nr:bifunctional demethylmenaquinone methyltransferase/2-methoxy-6-polyprenyl-1,4-benzoquinol methylase UbiE [Candidatus Competibacteraceae bacterium]
MNVTPIKDSDKSKKEQVADMFDNISQRYDFLNHFLSLGIDRLWRKQLVKMVQNDKPRSIIDVATGTGDLAIALAKTYPDVIEGIDISEGMLSVGRKKIEKQNLAVPIHLQWGDSENIPFDDNSFDVATAAFGVRNFENPLKGLKEMHRVLKPGGKIYVLEFSQPSSFPFKQIYTFYFRHILPLWGRLVSKHASAYSYLPESVQAFPYGKNFTDLLAIAGFKQTGIRQLTFGVASIYTGIK